MTTADEYFWEEFSRILKDAKKLTEARRKPYNADESILEFWINGPDDLVYELNKKVMRLRRQFKTDTFNLTRQTESFDSVLDDLVDNINYSAFLYALLKTMLVADNLEDPGGILADIIKANEKRHG